MVKSLKQILQSLKNFKGVTVGILRGIPREVYEAIPGKILRFVEASLDAHQEQHRKEKILNLIFRKFSNYFKNFQINGIICEGIFERFADHLIKIIS